jgi:hypothetical protein
VFDKVTITYRGAKYEIGRGRAFYGIWTVGASRSQPLQWWPETEEGWSAAWTKFTEIEAPGTITPVGRRTPPVASGGAQLGESAASRGGSTTSPGAATALLEDRTAPPRPRDVPVGLAGVSFGDTTGPVGNIRTSYEQAGYSPSGYDRTGIVGAALLAVGVIIGIIGLFPAYLAGTSLAQQNAQLVPHAIYLAVWTASAALILLGGVRLRLGALLAVGISAVTFGLFFADAGTAIAGGAHYGGWGLWLSLVGWLACAAGSVVAFLARSAGTGVRDSQVVPGRRAFLGRPRGAQVGPVVMLVLAGLGAAAAFAPAWDSYTLRTAAGQSQSLTAGNAFSNPGLVITGDVLVMVALAAVVIVAALWRPIQHGAVLLAGAIIPMVAQAISALIQAGEPTSPTQFGISSAEATRLGLTINSGVTPAFWIYCAFLVALVVSCAWMLFTPHEVIGSVAGPGAGPDVYTWNAAAPDAADESSVRPSGAADDWAADPDDLADLDDEEAGSGAVPGYETTSYKAPGEGDQPTA